MPSNTKRLAFVECVLAGEAFDTDIDDYVEKWHDSGSQLSLASYLGLSKDEYALWVEQPAALRMILYSKRHQIDVKFESNWNELHLLAARSLSEGESATLIQWLSNKGYIN